MNILYLENHAVFAQQVMQQFLSAHRVTVVPSISAARSAMASDSFDLVLSDYDLDDGKGEAFVRECRATHPFLPIIAVSSHDAGNAALLAAGPLRFAARCSLTKFKRSSVNWDVRKQSNKDWSPKAIGIAKQLLTIFREAQIESP
jgi:CheY-like chemotaxis protein